MAGYVIAEVQVTDPERYAEYREQVNAGILAYGGRFLARANPAQVYDNAVAQRVVLIEFPSVAAAVAAHDSPAYGKALEALGDAVDRDIRIVEGAE